jgi:asparagine synthase (glutamine-hydrolysing)
MVRFLGTEHRRMRCTRADIARIFPEVVWHTEKPILRTAPAPLYLLSGLVREHGYKVVLTGEGSDEMLGGYDIFKEAKLRRFCAARPESHRRPLLFRRLYPYLPRVQSQPDAYLRAFFEARPGDAESEFFSHLPRWRLTSALKRLFSASTRSRIRSYDGYAELRSTLPPGFPGWDGFCQAQYLEAAHLLPGYILSSQGDRVSMAHSVETRMPFLDHRLVEFAARLPPRLKMRALDEKYLLKRCARELLPASVVRRPKQPYRAPDASCFLGDARPDWVDELLSPERIRRDGVFDPRAVEQAVRKVREGRAIAVKDDMALVGVLSTQLLVDRFIRSAREDLGHAEHRAATA